MTLRRLLQHTCIIGYIVVTLSALTYTLTGIVVPIPWRILHYSYGMMAPYQRFEFYNQELRVQGQRPDGAWEVIDHQPYFPFLRGERVVRGWLWSFRDRAEHPDEWRDQYRQLARHLMRLEAQQGRQWQAVRLLWQTWPKSAEAFDALRRPPFLHSTFLVQVP